MPACAVGSVAVRRLVALLPGAGMRRGGRQLCRHFDFFHPLGNKAGICPRPRPLPSCPSHGDGSRGGGKAGEMPRSWGGEGPCAGAEGGAHGYTRLAHPVPAALSPRHGEAHGMPISVPSSPRYQHPAQTLPASTWRGLRATSPTPTLGSEPRGGQWWDPAFAPQDRGQRNRLELPGRFGHPLLLQINGCAVKKIEAIILSSHPLYPPTSTT